LVKEIGIRDLLEIEKHKALFPGKLIEPFYCLICKRSLGAGEKYIVETSHLMAFDINMSMSPRGADGIISLYLSSEGLAL
jgi:uncharacterized protein (AIM24 family)